MSKGKIIVKRTVELESHIEDIIDDTYGSVQEFLDAMIEINTVIKLRLKGRTGVSMATENRIELPEEVKPFRGMLLNTGGNDPEELLYRLENERNLASTNIFVFTMAVSVESQVKLIKKLIHKGKLKLEE